MENNIFVYAGPALMQASFIRGMKSLLSAITSILIILNHNDAFENSDSRATDDVKRENLTSGWSPNFWNVNYKLIGRFVDRKAAGLSVI